MNNRNLKRSLAAALLAFCLPAMAEDIDLFVGAQPLSTDLPNLLVIIDNAAAFSANAPNCTYSDGTAPSLNGTAGGWEQCAFVNVINVLPTNADGTAKVNIGMMGYNSNNGRDINNANCGGTVGGCLYVPLLPMTAANKTIMLNWVKSWRTNGGSGSAYIKANGEATGAAMQEAWAYYAGNIGISGRNYAGVKPASGCSNNYVVFVGNAYGPNGSPADSAPGGNGPMNKLIAAPGSTAAYQAVITGTYTNQCGTTTIGASNHENRGYYADEWARYMKGVDLDPAFAGDQVITTYSIGVIGGACKPEYPALMKNMADVGGGKYFPTTSVAELSVAFATVLSEIQSVNSVFASVSLPVSVNTQGTYLNQVFVGMFRPDPDGLPRWAGNLKQYKLGLAVPGDTSSLRLEDADNAAAISAGESGFIAECARSFWTPVKDVNENYWAFRPQGNCVGYENDNSPDGNIVEKGAQAYKLRSTTTRTVKTCSATFASCTALTDFNNTNVTQADLGAASTTERDALINWEKGQDVSDEDADGVTTAEMRPSAHGDVVHSRPVAINFGTDASPQVVVFYGGNDGVLRAVNGNRTAAIGSVAAGAELWSFVAPEFFGQIKRLRDNTTQINYKGNTTTTPTPLPKPYGFDGSIVAYQDATHSWIYPSLRRGGRVLYSFDVTTPASPSLKWKRGCPNQANDTGCSTDYTGLGQTWSSPKSTKASGFGSGTSPMLIMGGGYDTCEDFDNGTQNNNCTSSSKGKSVFVINADTGAVLKELVPLAAGNPRPMVADIFVIEDSSGLAKWAYAADMGGNIYRISGVDANTPFASTAPANWTITKIASLGCNTIATCNANRKFMFAPDMVQDPTDGSYIILIGSGDREKPLNTFTAAYGVVNHFFMVRDKPTDSAWLTSENATCGADVICRDSLLFIPRVSGNPTAADLAAKKGWYLGLNGGEQVVTSAITVFGVVTYSTQEPVVLLPGACSSNLGTARVYNVGYTDAAPAYGTARWDPIKGGGLPPSPVAGLVTLDGADGAGGPIPFIIGSSGQSALEGRLPNPPPTTIRPKGRTYWYIQK